MVYGVVRPIVLLLARALWRLRIVGSERVPATGPCVLAPSHRSILDALFAPLATRRRVRSMAKRELWSVPGLGALVEALGGFPVERSAAADRSALRTAVEVLEAGEPLVIFPEGTRRTGRRIEDLHDGAAYVAARLQVPVVPIGIAGSEEILPKGSRFPRLRKVVMVVGEPVQAPRHRPLGEGEGSGRRRGSGVVRRSDVRAFTDEIGGALQKAFDEADAALADASRLRP